MPASLLFEIGCEEIPAKMLARALAELPAQLAKKLDAARLAHGDIVAYGTPRRLAVIAHEVADRQSELDELVVGPPVGAAFAPDGSLTKAGQGFAAKNGVDASAIAKQEVAGKKGLYAVARRHVAGEPTRALLPALLAELAAGITWPKSMRWGWSEAAFVRPVQWLVALFGGEVVPLAWAGQTAGRATRGHRFLSPGWHELADASAYVPALRAAHVMVDPAERRATVVRELERLAGEAHLKMRPDEPLVAEVMHLGEWPVGIAGGFDPAFLDVPEEMIVTAMRTHQRYFAFEDAQGKLAPKFATLAATIVGDPAVVSRGNEKVLASRLSDAKFFFGEDKKHSFDDWNKKLDGVVFQAKLGDGAKTIGHKVGRLVTIVQSASAKLPIHRDAAAMAAHYCKADLASLAVGEFPELQGTMGKHYARFHRLPDAVADAIEQHWWPKGQGAELPTTAEAALVSLADKADTIVGCFSVGLEPTGSADPFGLRRAAIGIWQILLDRGWREVYPQLVQSAQQALHAQGVARTETAKLDDFMKTRLRGILIEQGIPAQDADAALAQGWHDPIDARARALACGKISKEAREVFKRVANILDDARGKKLAIGEAPAPDSFVADAERKLHDAVKTAHVAETDARRGQDYPAVFASLEQLRPTVAAFFDKGGVMVMDPDPKLRDNRLALLNWFITPYMQIADFRLLGGAQ
ncbi:MAG TPA: glycine--tRNA ligase subunit beta [Kofleriaceae bacterium]